MANRKIDDMFQTVRQHIYDLPIEHVESEKIMQTIHDIEALLQEREREAVEGFYSFLSLSPWIDEGYLKYLKVDVDIYLKQKEVQHGK